MRALRRKKLSVQQVPETRTADNFGFAEHGVAVIFLFGFFMSEIQVYVALADIPESVLIEILYVFIYMYVYTYIYIHVYICTYILMVVQSARIARCLGSSISLPSSGSSQQIQSNSYWVASVCWIDKIIGLLCKRALQETLYSAKETCNCINPTNRSHLICIISPINFAAHNGV